MKRALRWVVGFVVVFAAGGVVGFLMHFVPGIDSGPWTGIMALIVGFAVFMWLRERGWW